MSICRKITILFITPEGETHSARIEFTSTFAAIAEHEKLDNIIVEALQRWETESGVQIIDVSQQEAKKQLLEGLTA